MKVQCRGIIEPVWIDRASLSQLTLLNMLWTSLERWHRNHLTKTAHSSKLTVAPKADGFLDHVKGFWCVLRGPKMLILYPDHVPSWSGFTLTITLNWAFIFSSTCCGIFNAFCWRVSKFFTFKWIQVYLHSWFIFRPNLHQVFVGRHQWRHVNAPWGTECKSSSLLTWNDSSVFFVCSDCWVFRKDQVFKLFQIMTFFHQIMTMIHVISLRCNGCLNWRVLL